MSPIMPSLRLCPDYVDTRLLSDT